MKPIILALLAVSLAGQTTRQVLLVRGTAPTGDFTFSVSSSVSITQGSTATLTASAVPTGGFTGVVSASVTSGLPSGVTASACSSTLIGSSSCNFTLTASSGATVGTSTVTVTALSGGLSHTATSSLTVSIPSPVTYRSVYVPTNTYAVNDLAILASSDTLWQSLGTSTGVTPGTDATKWANVSFSLTTPPGATTTTASVSAGYQGYWDSLISYLTNQFVSYGTNNQLFQATANTTSAIPGVDAGWSAVTYVLTPYARGVYDLVPTYAPLDVVTFNGGTYTSNTVNTGSVPPATSNADWTLTSGSSNGPTFLSSVTPSSATWHGGSASNFVVTYTPVQGFTGVITPSIANLPTGVTSACLPSTVTTSGSTTCTLTAASTTTPATTGNVRFGGTAGGVAGLTPGNTSITILAPGLLTISNSSFTSPLNITAVGTDDWSIFTGASSSLAAIRKSGGTLLPPSLGHTAVGDPGIYNIGTPNSITWTDAAGTATGSTSVAPYLVRGGDTWLPTMAADLTIRTAYIYLAQICCFPNDTLTVSASISGTGAPSPTSLTFTLDKTGDTGSTAGGSNLIAIQYQAAAAGQTLSLTLNNGVFQAIALTH